jgi:hypothetical protein
MLSIHEYRSPMSYVMLRSCGFSSRNRRSNSLQMPAGGLGGGWWARLQKLRGRHTVKQRDAHAGKPATGATKEDESSPSTACGTPS